jgi:hypothetical protein
VAGEFLVQQLQREWHHKEQTRANPAFHLLTQQLYKYLKLKIRQLKIAII